MKFRCPRCPSIVPLILPCHHTLARHIHIFCPFASPLYNITVGKNALASFQCIVGNRHPAAVWLIVLITPTRRAGSQCHQRSHLIPKCPRFRPRAWRDVFPSWRSRARHAFSARARHVPFALERRSCLRNIRWPTRRER